ncbi:hypothetical protein AB0J86_20240 [Micromonospora sp. NPDC049559]|uniref:hypothetical protein n=1 Tax=Micromonospora sp. NPDC049559 TaxID=3155923 RepID=UPI00343A3B02
MPAVANLSRVLSVSIAAMLPLAGCAAIEDGGRVIGRADLVNDLAARLDRAGELTYWAEYQLPGGQSAAIAQAQKPLRAAYTYPGGKLTVTADSTAECDTAAAKPTCTLNPPPSPSTRPSVTVFASANKRGLVTPPVVIGLLTAAALDPSAVIEQQDTTVAGRHATCVQVDGLANAPTSSFNACVTTEGALGRFRGVLDGKEADLALSRYRTEVDSGVFDLPSGAGVIDRRAGTR